MHGLFATIIIVTSITTAIAALAGLVYITFMGEQK